MHALWGQIIFLQRQHPTRFDARGVPDNILPLFPGVDGWRCTKEAITATILRAGDLLGVPLHTIDGSERTSRHSLRVTGAHGLARLGVDLRAI